MKYSGKAPLIYNYIYFYHLDKFCILPLYPETVNDNMKSSFTPTNALSRSAPVFTYQNSGPRTVTISLDLHRDMMNDVNTSGGVDFLDPDVVDFRDDDYIDTLIKYLQAIALPQYQVYNSGKSKSVDPPMIAIRLGDGIFIKGIVDSGINVTWKLPINEDNKYVQANINFTVSEVEPYDAASIVRKGSFRDTAAGIRVDRFSR